MSSANDRLLRLATQAVDKSKPVLVTGVDGYVGGVLTATLLETGFRVHGTYYTSDRASLDYLNVGPGELELFQANLLNEHDFDDAMKGCQVVFHTASPFVVRHGLDPDELLKPAIVGTRHVLNAATKIATVRRVVLTSSLGATYGDATDTSRNEPASEATWNRSSNRRHQSYFYSKTLAEQVAWVLAGSQRQWTLVAMNPGLVVGPGRKVHVTSESFRMIKRLCGGHWSMWFGCPRIAMPMVDVRDVAVAHILGAFNENLTGRFVLCSSAGSLFDAAVAAREIFPLLPIPSRPSFVPKWLVWLVTPYMRQGVDRPTVWCNLNAPVYVDRSKSVTMMGLSYYPLADSLRQMIEQLQEEGSIQTGWPPDYIGICVVGLIVAAATFHRAIAVQ